MSELKAEVAEVQRRTHAGVEQRVDVVLWTEGRGGTVRVEHETSESVLVTEQQTRSTSEAPAVPGTAPQPYDGELRELADRYRSALSLLGITLEDRPSEAER